MDVEKLPKDGAIYNCGYTYFDEWGARLECKDGAFQAVSEEARARFNRRCALAHQLRVRAVCPNHMTPVRQVVDS